MEEGEVGGGEKFAPPSLLTSRTREELWRVQGIMDGICPREVANGYG